MAPFQSTPAVQLTCAGAVRACAALMWDTPEFAWAHNEVDGKVERDPEATVALTRVVLPGFIKTGSPVGCHAYMDSRYNHSRVRRNGSRAIG